MGKYRETTAILTCFSLLAVIILPGCSTYYVTKRAGVYHQYPGDFSDAQLCGSEIYVDEIITVTRDYGSYRRELATKTAIIDLKNRDESLKPSIKYENKTHRPENCAPITIFPTPDYNDRGKLRPEEGEAYGMYFTRAQIHLVERDIANSGITKTHDYRTPWEGDYSTGWRPLLFPLTPVTLAFDIITFPLQVVLFLMYADATLGH